MKRSEYSTTISLSAGDLLLVPHCSPIHQSFFLSAANSCNGPIIRVFPRVPTKFELPRVAQQVLFADVVERADDPALQQQFYKCNRLMRKRRPRSRRASPRVSDSVETALCAAFRVVSPSHGTARSAKKSRSPVKR